MWNFIIPTLSGVAYSDTDGSVYEYEWSDDGDPLFEQYQAYLDATYDLLNS